MLAYSLILIILLVAFYLYKQQIKKYKQQKFNAWKQSLNLKDLVTDYSLRGEAKKSWIMSFHSLLCIYVDACNSLKIPATASFYNIKKVLENHPEYVNSKISSYVQLEDHCIKYTHVNEGSQRKIVLEISEADLKKPEYMRYNVMSDTYSRPCSWDY